jgi:hypothetical protein
MPDIKATDILIGPLKIFTAPLGTTLPVDTLAEDAAWPAGWVQLAYTKESLKMSYEMEALEVEVEEAYSAVHRRKTKETLKFETVLAEFTTQNLAYAFDGTHTADTAPGASTEGLESFVAGGKRFFTERLWGFEGKLFSRDGATAVPVRLFVWRAVAETGGELEFGKAQYSGIPLKMVALADTSKALGQQLFRIARVLPQTNVV